MDYRELLLKYMQLVRDWESVTYTEVRPRAGGVAQSQADFSDDEWEELTRLASLTKP